MSLLVLNFFFGEEVKNGFICGIIKKMVVVVKLMFFKNLIKFIKVFNIWIDLLFCLLGFLFFYLEKSGVLNFVIDIFEDEYKLLVFLVIFFFVKECYIYYWFEFKL